MDNMADLDQDQADQSEVWGLDWAGLEFIFNYKTPGLFPPCVITV